MSFTRDGNGEIPLPTVKSGWEKRLSGNGRRSPAVAEFSSLIHAPFAFSPEIDCPVQSELTSRNGRIEGYALAVTEFGV